MEVHSNRKENLRKLKEVQNATFWPFLDQFWLFLRFQQNGTISSPNFFLTPENYSENEVEFNKRIQKTSLRTFSGFSQLRISECG